MTLDFLKSVFSEPDGTGSTSRILIALLVTFVVGVGVSFGVAVHLHKLTARDFDDFLSAAGMFVVTTTGPLYGINKTAAFLSSKQDNKQGN